MSIFEWAEHNELSAGAFKEEILLLTKIFGLAEMEKSGDYLATWRFDEEGGGKTIIIVVGAEGK